MYVITLLLCITVIFISLWRRKQRKANYPPGLSGFPIIGVLPYLSKPGPKLMEWSKIYGPIYHAQIGMKEFVVLNDFASINECFLKQGKYTSSRSDLRMFTIDYKSGGLVFQSYTEEYKLLRKTVVAAIKGSGITKRDVESKIQHQMEHIIEGISAEKGKPIRPQNILNVAISSLIMSIVSGGRVEHHNPQLSLFINLVKEVWNHPVDSPINYLISMLDGLKYVPIFSSSFQRMRTKISKQAEIMQNFIDNHQSTFQEENVIGVADELLLAKKYDPSNQAYKNYQMQQTIYDLFGAGTDTVSLALEWSLLYLAKFPEVQLKLATEISNSIGCNVPRWSYRDCLPLTCSFIDEILRHRSIASMTIHKMDDDINLQGYIIPKDTLVMASIWSAHYDPACFKDPEKFIPERFVDKETGKYVKSKYILAFGTGPRKCLGFQLAEKEIFMFLTAILQRFELKENQEYPLPSFDDGNFGGLHFPQKFKISFEER